jgi:hypothetical protein
MLGLNLLTDFLAMLFHNNFVLGQFRSFCRKNSIG